MEVHGMCYLNSGIPWNGDTKRETPQQNARVTPHVSAKLIYQDHACSDAQQDIIRTASGAWRRCSVGTPTQTLGIQLVWRRGEREDAQRASQLLGNQTHTSPPATDHTDTDQLKGVKPINHSNVSINADYILYMTYCIMV